MAHVVITKVIVLHMPTRLSHVYVAILMCVSLVTASYVMVTTPMILATVLSVSVTVKCIDMRVPRELEFQSTTGNASLVIINSTMIIM